MATRPPVPGEDAALLGVRLGIAVILSVVSEVMVAHHVWSPWLTWWSGPVISFALIFAGFWFFMWLMEVITDGDF